MRFHAHQFGGFEIGHHNDGFADQFFGFVVLGDSGDNGALFSQIDAQLQQFVGLGHRRGFQNFGDAQIHFGEIVIVDRWFDIGECFLWGGGRGFLFGADAREKRFTPAKRPARGQGFLPADHVKVVFKIRIKADLPQNLFGCLRHERRYKNGHIAQRFQQTVHNGGKFFLIAWVFGERPRFVFHDVFVGGADELPDGHERLVQRHLGKTFFHFGNGGARQLRKLFFNGRSGRGGNFSVAVFDRHGQGAAHQVAQIVGQMGVEPEHKGLFRKVGIQAEDHVAQQEVAKSVESVLVFQIQRPDDVAQALGHFAGIRIPVAVHVEMLIRFDARSLEHGRPVNAVRFQNILGDEMLGLAPEFMKVRAVRISHGGDVVDERVKPHIGDIFVVKRQLDAPFQTGFGA